MSEFLAYRATDGDAKAPRLEITRMTRDALTAGDVLIRARWSDINYKDALAVTGRGRIFRELPLNAGIDVAGEVAESADPRFREGDTVVVTGSGLGEYLDGGYAQYVRVPAESVIHLPREIDARDAMAIGTAGFTAALAVHQMQLNGQDPAAGPVLVTGATGGVGSVAIDLLAGRGFEVHALTGKADAADYLRGLGAAEVLARDAETPPGQRPLERVRFAGAIDNLGGDWLAWLTRTTGFFGNVASVGLAAGAEFSTTVMPFILRGVNLLGIHSVETPRALRERLWQRLASDLRPRHLDRIVTGEVTLEQLPGHFDRWVRGEVTGRTVVRID